MGDVPLVQGGQSSFLVNTKDTPKERLELKVDLGPQTSSTGKTYVDVPNIEIDVIGPNGTPERTTLPNFLKKMNNEEGCFVSYGAHAQDVARVAIYGCKSK